MGSLKGQGSVQLLVPLCRISWVVPALILSPHPSVLAAALLPFPHCLLPYRFTATKKEQDLLFEFGNGAHAQLQDLCFLHPSIIIYSVTQCPLSTYYVLL